MKLAAQAISEFDQKTIAEIEKNGMHTLELDGESFELELSDFEITAEDIPGLKVASDRDLTVALDIEISESLALEGLAKEIVNRIQNMRKDRGFEITDRICVKLGVHREVQKCLKLFSNYIAEEVLATELIQTELKGENIDLVDGIEIPIEISKV
jgi:isoleucyl-tRNA synthetase